MKLLVSIIAVKDDWNVIGGIGHISIISSQDKKIDLEKVYNENRIRNVITKYDEVKESDKNKFQDQILEKVNDVIKNFNLGNDSQFS